MALFGGTAPMVIGGFFVSLAALVFHVIGFSTPYWYALTDGHMGLWQSCGKTPTGTVCISIPPPGASLSGEYKAAQALECIALVAYLAAAVFGSLRVFVVKDNGTIYVATALFNFAAGASLSGEYKAAQALECIALVAYLAAAVFGSLRVFVVKDNGTIYVATALFNFAAGCIGLIGIIVFATQELAPGVTLDSSNFHFSFAFCIIAAIGGIGAGVVFILAWRWIHLRQ